MSGDFDRDIRALLLEPESKLRYNERHFGVAAPKYDFATRAMSLGRDAAWKRCLVNSLPPHASPSCADLACGTGDVAFLLAGKYPGGSVAGLDISEPMLEEARKRNVHGNVRFMRGDMCATGFPDGALDMVTGSYALRNAPDLEEAFHEIHRILKPGGTAAFLDFAKPARPLIQALQRRLLWTWCGSWGFLLHGSREIHGYIAASLASWPDRGGLRKIVARAGFDLVHERLFYLGMLELIVLRKRQM